MNHRVRGRAQESPIFGTGLTRPGKLNLQTEEFFALGQFPKLSAQTVRLLIIEILTTLNAIEADAKAMRMHRGL